MRLQACHMLLAALHLTHAAVFPRVNLSDRRALLSDDKDARAVADGGNPVVVRETVTVREGCTATMEKRQDDSGIPADAFEGLRLSFITETETVTASQTQERATETKTVTVKGDTVTETKEAVTVTHVAEAAQTAAPAEPAEQPDVVSKGATITAPGCLATPPASEPASPGGESDAVEGGDKGIVIVPLDEANVSRTTLSFDPLATSEPSPSPEGSTGVEAGEPPASELPLSTSVSEEEEGGAPPVTVVPAPAAPESTTEPTTIASPSEPTTIASTPESTTLASTTTEPETIVETEAPVASEPPTAEKPAESDSSDDALDGGNEQEQGESDGGNNNLPDPSAPADEANQGEEVVELPPIDLSTYSLESQLDLGGLVLRTAGPEPTQT